MIAKYIFNSSLNYFVNMTKSHIPDHIQQKYENENVSKDFIRAAEEYYKSCSAVTNIHVQLEKAVREKDNLREQMKSMCTHRYEVQPREYQTPREYICAICGDYI